MRKAYLLKWDYPKFFTLADWIDYELYLEIVWFWGLFKTYKKKTCRVYNLQNAKSFYDHWDKLISERTPL